MQDKATRRFRNPESLESEQITRGMLTEFLIAKGFTEITDSRVQNGQTIIATSPDGSHLSMRVRLCWRRDPGSRDSDLTRTYSAAQLMSDIGKDDWLQAISKKIKREQSHGVTHLLFVQSDAGSIVYAALVPLQDYLPIWIAQRDASARLIQAGQLGRRHKNHAMNGVSPTIWLQDDRAPEVAQQLWQHPGVLDLAKLPVVYDGLLNLSDRDADPKDANSESSYSPSNEDLRHVIECQIRERRGQQRFRDLLIARYRSRCQVTGCEVIAVLEAAHIKPYRGESDNHPENGLLLRSDIHTLFDLDLLGIDPDQLKIQLHPSATKEYGQFEGTMLKCRSGQHPAQSALRIRYRQFQSKLLQTS